jgi:hypothetical protein
MLMCPSYDFVRFQHTQYVAPRAFVERVLGWHRPLSSVFPCTLLIPKARFRTFWSKGPIGLGIWWMLLFLSGFFASLSFSHWLGHTHSISSASPKLVTLLVRLGSFFRRICSINYFLFSGTKKQAFQIFLSHSPSLYIHMYIYIYLSLVLCSRMAKHLNSFFKYFLMFFFII